MEAKLQRCGGMIKHVAKSTETCKQQTFLLKRKKSEIIKKQELTGKKIRKQEEKLINFAKFYSPAKKAQNGDLSSSGLVEMSRQQSH